MANTLLDLYIDAVTENLTNAIAGCMNPVLEENKLLKQLCSEALDHLRFHKVNHFSPGHRESLEERIEAALNQATKT